MGFLDRIERRFRGLAVPNLTMIIIIGQVIFYISMPMRPEMLEKMLLITQKVMEGEYWRLFSFVFTPPVENPIFFFFGMYIFFIMGTALEQNWGAFRYNLFLLIAYLATVAASFVTPAVPSTNGYIGGSVFLAFAYLYPDFTLYLFFVLPVKVKWLALFTWVGYGFQVLTGDLLDRLLVVISVMNFFLFFGSDILRRARGAKKRMAKQTSHIQATTQPFHTCATCGITDKTHPMMDFRYCPECEGGLGYCTDHIGVHEHLKKS